MDNSCRVSIHALDDSSMAETYVKEQEATIQKKFLVVKRVKKLKEVKEVKYIVIKKIIINNHYSKRIYLNYKSIKVSLYKYKYNLGKNISFGK